MATTELRQSRRKMPRRMLGWTSRHLGRLHIRGRNVIWLSHKPVNDTGERFPICDTDFDLIGFHHETR